MPPVLAAIGGHPAHLLSLPALSSGGSRSRLPPAGIRDDLPGEDAGYLAGVLCMDANVLTIYYGQDATSVILPAAFRWQLAGQPHERLPASAAK